MKTFACWVSLCFAATAFAEKPLAVAAAPFAEKLPAGCIVTGEWIGGKASFSVSGKAEPEGIPPEKRVFEIGSITKVFTGLLLSEAVLTGKVRLDSTLGEVLGADQKFADPDVAAITLLQLSTHTSGLPRLPTNMGWFLAFAKDPYAKYDLEDALEFLAKAKLDHAPPFPPSYSNFGVGLLGELLAGLHGKSWAELVEEKITGPLGMKDTAMTLDAEQIARLAPPYAGGEPGHAWTFQAMAGAGALRSTAADLVHFGQALIAPDKTQLAAAIRGMLEVRAEFGGGKDIGLGIMIGKFDGQREYTHEGGTGGYRSLLQVVPERGLVRVVLINNDAVSPQSPVIAVRDEKPSQEPGHKLAAADLDAYRGVYQIDAQARLTVLRRGGSLYVRLTGQPFLPLVPLGKDRFRYNDVAAELQFTRAGPAVVSLVLHQHGRELPAKRTADVPADLTFPPADELKAYAGEYDLAPGNIITVTVSGETLFAQLTGQPAFPVFQANPGYFEYDVVAAALEFRRGKDGAVTGLTLHQNGKHRAKKR